MTSRVSAIVRLECLRMLEEGVGSASDIDKALRLGLNFPMGPLELGDFNGLDTYLDALEAAVVRHTDLHTSRVLAELTARSTEPVQQSILGEGGLWTDRLPCYPSGIRSRLELPISCGRENS